MRVLSSIMRGSARRGFAALLAASLVVTAFAAACGSDEPDFPTRDVEWFVGFAAGGGFDTASRLIADKMSDELGVNVVVRNIEGGGGRRAVQEIARSDPDGHAISIMNMPNQITAERLDPEDVNFNELAWVGRAVIQTYGLYTASANDFNTPEDLQGMPDVRFCLSGLAGHSFLVASVTTEVMDIAWNPVTGYRGQETQAGLLRGDCELALGPIAGTTLSAVQGPDFKVLWMYSSERFGPVPDAPTVDELGYPELGGSKFANNGLVAAAPGTPDSAIETLSEAFANALADPAVIEGINNAGMDIVPLTPAETADAVAGMDGIVSEYIDTVRAKSQAQ